MSGGNPSFSLRAAVPVLLALFLLAGCSSEPDTVTYSVIVDVGDLPQWAAPRFFADGKEVQPVLTYRWKDPDSGDYRGYYSYIEVVGSYQPPTFFHGTPPGGPHFLPTLTMQFLLPCGWKEVALTARSSGLTEAGRKWHLERAVSEDASRKIAAADIRFLSEAREPLGEPSKIHTNPVIHVWVDNRGGPAHDLSLGELHHPILADTYESFRLLAPDCEEAATLKLDGQDIGAVPLRRADDPMVPDRVLVDTSGSRCYRLRRLHYGQGLNPTPPPLMLVRKPAHVFNASFSVMYMFEEAPETITVKTPQGIPGFGFRGELLEARCP
ncbi:MAG: hypothetical protein L0170_02450 [Acidobacteria bacterium]|nr:hypothetical protein [Acidobacteriota bacterium]